MKFLSYAAENISAMIFGLLGAAMVARVFGPENMGRLSIVQSVSAVFIFFATLGFEHFIVRDLTRNPNDQELKGSVLVAQSIGWLIYILAVISYFIVKGNWETELPLILSVTISTFFLRVIYLKLFLQSINQARIIATAAIISRCVALMYLFVGSYIHLSYEAMIFFLPIQGALQTFVMWLGYKRITSKSNIQLTYSWLRVKKLLIEASPVLLATAIYYGYSQADVLIVSYFMNEHDVGIYSAAMRLIPQAAFIGHIAAITFYSQISQSFDVNHALFLSNAKKIVRLQFSLALVISITGAILSGVIIYCLYGDKFSASAPILAIGVWAWLFMIPAALFSRLLVLTKIAKFELIKAFIVAPVSLMANIILIPKFGMHAAAVVTVLTYMFGDFFVYAFFKQTRFMFYLGLSSIRDIIFHPISTFKESFQLITSKVRLE